MRPLLLLSLIFGCEEKTGDCAKGGCLELRCNAEDPCCASVELSEAECGADPLTADGWNDAPGSGPVFVVSSFAIAGESFGDDLDGLCDETGCADNAVGMIGQLMNDQIRQGLLGGEVLLLVEIAGLVPDYRGWDRSVTVKIYSARDADDPFFPANNFEIPPGQTTCCEFLVHPESLSSGTALARIHARIRDGRIETIERASMTIPVVSSDGCVSITEYGRAGVLARFPAGMNELSEGLVTGALLVRSVADIDNPYCKTVSSSCPVRFGGSSLADAFSSLGVHPDIDLDGDGLECLFDVTGDGVIDRCCSQCETTCTGPEVPPVDPATPYTCTNNVSDAYSVAYGWAAVPAKIVGTAP